jgi:hypothetical protein
VLKHIFMCIFLKFKNTLFRRKISENLEEKLLVIIALSSPHAKKGVNFKDFQQVKIAGGGIL